MKTLLIASFLTLAGCVHVPSCGNLAGANVVFEDANNCRVRIRQVILGTDFHSPLLLDGTGSAIKMDWIKTTEIDGKIELGHFVLSPAGHL